MLAGGERKQFAANQMVRNDSTCEIREAPLTAAAPEIASFRRVLRLDADRVRSAFHQEGGCCVIIIPQRLQLPTGAIDDSEPVVAIDKNGKVGLQAVAFGARRFKNAYGVLQESAHTLHIGR